MMPQRAFRLASAAFAFALLLQAAKADTLYIATFDTSSLVGHPAGPFFLAIEMTDGSGVNDANNTVTLQSFNFYGGGAIPGTLTFGGVTGDVYSGISITDNSFLSLFEQQFIPGSKLSFSLGLTSNGDDGGVPDGMSFFILDTDGVPLPTLAPGGDPFLTAAFLSTGDLVDTYGSDPSRSLSTGNAISMPAPVLTPVAVTPEPPSAWLCSGGVVLLWSLIRQRASRAMHREHK